MDEFVRCPQCDDDLPGEEWEQHLGTHGYLKRSDAAPPKNIVEAADRVIDKLQQAAAVQDGAAPPKEAQRMVKCDDCQVWHRPDEPCPIHEAKNVTEMCWYDRDSQTLGFMVDGERCYVKMERFIAPPPSDAAPVDPQWYITVRDWIDGLLDDDCEHIRCNPNTRAALHRKNIELRESGYTADAPPGMLRDLQGAVDFLRMHIDEGKKCCRHCGETATRRYNAARHALNRLQPLYAHPEDAPGGPTAGQIAEDALNRLKGKKEG